MQAMDEPEHVKSAGGPPKKRAKKADTLVYYATTNGNLAYTGENSESCFTTVLCEVMKELFKQNTVGKPLYHLNDVIVTVNDLLSTEVGEIGQSPGYETAKERIDVQVQMSEACSTLTKKIYFYKKDL